jgi:hypothetical protein
MNDHRPRAEMPRFDVATDRQTGSSADRRRQLPAWNRERLIRQFQDIDGSTRSEAERQVDAYERSFSSVFAAPSIAGATRGDAKD